MLLAILAIKLSYVDIFKRSQKSLLKECLLRILAQTILAETVWFLNQTILGSFLLILF